MNEQLLYELNRERKKVLPAFCIFYFFLVLGILFFVIVPTGPRFLLYSIIFFVISALVYFAWYSPNRKKYVANYKESIVQTLFREQFDHVNYLPGKGFSKNFIKETGFMMLGNRYSSEDMVLAQYKNIPFTRCDVTIQDHRSNGKSSYTVTYFQGRWITLKCNKQFSTDVQIIQKGFSYSDRKRKSFLFRSEDRRHKVEFENEAFNSKFECYCQTDQDAFYLITPQIMEKLMQYSLVADGKLMLGFRNNIIHLAINSNKDALEPHIWGALTYQNDILPVKKEINIITDFINLLSLDRTIFSI